MRDKDQNGAWAPPAWLGESSGSPDAPSVEEPFILPVQEVPRDLWSRHDPQPEPAVRKPPKQPRRLSVALPFVILFGLLSAFFSWVSAEPLWLAVGHGQTGTATVTRCVGDGVTRRCLGDFATEDYSVVRITLLGLTDADTTVGKTVTAQMVSERSQRAYAGGGGFMLRWLPGLTLVMLCGLAIVMVTGIWRLGDRRERWAAVGVSMAAPLLVTVGFLAAAF